MKKDYQMKATLTTILFVIICIIAVLQEETITPGFIVEIIIVSIAFMAILIVVYFDVENQEMKICSKQGYENYLASVKMIKEPMKIASKWFYKKFFKKAIQYSLFCMIIGLGLKVSLIDIILMGIISLSVSAFINSSEIATFILCIELFIQSWYYNRKINLMLNGSNRLDESLLNYYKVKFKDAFGLLKYGVNCKLN